MFPCPSRRRYKAQGAREKFPVDQTSLVTLNLILTFLGMFRWLLSGLSGSGGSVVPTGT